MITVISAVIVLGILIFVHELGHFLLAKWAGVGVNTFSLGFGPRLVGFNKGGTDYRLSAIPLGGFVRMVGEHTGEEIPAKELLHSFSHKPVFWRLAIVVAGPFCNIIFALVTYFVLLMIWGLPTMTTQVGEVLPQQPAALAGVQEGDCVLAINGQHSEHWGDITSAVQGSQGRPLQMLLERHDRQISLTISPQIQLVKDIFGEEREIYRIGIKASGKTFIKSVGPFESMSLAVKRTYLAGEIIVLSVVKMMQRKMEVETLGGPILIAQVAGQAARQGLPTLMDLAALLSVNLAILNLLPIPALDGGHLFLFLLEVVTRRPVPISVREKANQVGVAILIMLMAFIFYNDIARLVAGGGQ